MQRRTLLAAIAAITLGERLALADAKFAAFLQGLWPMAQKAGLTRDVFDRAIAGTTEPDPMVLKLADNQPEFNTTTSDYLDKTVTSDRIATGQNMLKANAALLQALMSKFGVDKLALLGIWGIESNFGKQLGDMKVIRSLATLMYSGSRKAYGRQQMVAAFRILKSGVVKPEDFVGSWAGALGHTQFIPTSYLAYAVDWTGDGVKDIWHSKDDALASTANYLAKAGWRPEHPWGWEVTLPKDFNRALIGRATWKTAAEWSKIGVVPIAGGDFAQPDAKGFIMIPQEIGGPRFLVTQNFLAVMDYNDSHSYALAVCHLGDRIAGRGPIVAPWPSVSYDLSLPQRIELQQRLNRLGFETGGADGRIGARTYEAILNFQKKAGMPLDGMPSAKLLLRVRQGA
jgi:membrane-bound lytic murein transglycosylase B